MFGYILWYNAYMYKYKKARPLHINISENKLKRFSNL